MENCPVFLEVLKSNFAFQKLQVSVQVTQTSNVRIQRFVLLLTSFVMDLVTARLDLMNSNAVRIYHRVNCVFNLVYS